MHTCLCLCSNTHSMPLWERGPYSSLVLVQWFVLTQHLWVQVAIWSNVYKQNVKINNVCHIYVFHHSCITRLAYIPRPNPDHDTNVTLRDDTTRCRDSFIWDNRSHSYTIVHRVDLWGIHTHHYASKMPQYCLHQWASNPWPMAHITWHIYRSLLYPHSHIHFNIIFSSIIRIRSPSLCSMSCDPMYTTLE